jgi:hypothetical protein
MPSDSHHEERWSGILYTSSSNQRFREFAWTDWFFSKSKKVWFRIPSARIHPDSSRLYFYSGRPILHRRTWEALPPPARTKLSPVVFWGDEVVHGWREGPEDTNHFLYIWTRWSLLQLGACGHPERFAVEVDTPLARTVQGLSGAGSAGGDS